MHNKAPTDDNLILRGSALPCCKNVESAFDIYFECDYAVRIWSWLGNVLNMVLQFTSMENMCKLCDLN
jgi:hypothetical protein